MCVGGANAVCAFFHLTSEKIVAKGVPVSLHVHGDRDRSLLIRVALKSRDGAITQRIEVTSDFAISLFLSLALFPALALLLLLE